MKYKVKVLIVDNQVRCASQMCDEKCPNKHLCVDADLIIGLGRFILQNREKGKSGGGE